MKLTKQVFFEYYVSILALLFFALSVVVPKAIGIFPALVLLAALPFLFSKKTYSSLTKNNFVFIGGFLVYALLFMLNQGLFGEPLSEYDNPLRFILGIIVLLFVLRFPPKEHFLWVGIGLGGIITGCWALWEKFATGSGRVSAYTNPIHYGNLSILLGLLCLVGIGWAYRKQSGRLPWMLFMIAGSILGLLASGLSGSRGGWVSLVFVITYILLHYRGLLSRKSLLSAAAVIPVLLVVLFLIPQTGVKQRVMAVGHDLSLYSQGHTRTSVGGRLELWRGNLMLIKEKPLFGWGESAYTEKMIELTEKQVINPINPSHAHNEVLDAVSKRGLLGLIGLACLYLMPIYVFFNSRKSSQCSDSLPLMLTGGVIAIAYMDFGLTQVFLLRNIGVMFYVFALVFLYAALNSKHAESCEVAVSQGARPKPGE